MSHQRTEAEAMALCLFYGLRQVDDAIGWADQQIIAAETPHSSLLDVSMASRANCLDVANMLRQLPGDVDWKCVARKVVQQCASLLDQDLSNAKTITQALYYLNQRDEFPESTLPDRSYWFDDALDLADECYLGQSRVEVIEELRDSLKEFLSRGSDSSS